MLSRPFVFVAGALTATAVTGIARAQEAPTSDAPSGHAEPVATRVELASDDPRATLSRHVGTSLVVLPYRIRPKRVATWEDVCLAPCNRDVDPRELYRIDGEGITPSGSFFLPPGPQRLHARTGSRGRHAAGTVLTALGAAWAPTGAVLLGLSALPGETRTAFRTLGASFTGLGVVALAIGLPLFVANTTRVTDDSGRAVGRAARPWSLTPGGLTF